MEPTILTTGRQSSVDALLRAQALGEQWQLPVFPREGASIASVAEAARQTGYHVRHVIVVEEEDLALYTVEAKKGAETKGRSSAVFRYHPGMGVNRLRRLFNGEKDWMIEAMGIKRGDRVLDGTLGLGSDLLVASFVVGDEGLAVGIESQRIIALIVSEGLKTYRHTRDEINASLRRIQVIHGDSAAYVRTVAPGSFDVIYFDPMFERPVAKSAQMIPIRQLANRSPMSLDTFEQAAAKACRRVVVKDRVGGRYASSDWFDDVVGGKGSRIVFCIKYV